MTNSERNWLHKYVKDLLKEGFDDNHIIFGARKQGFKKPTIQKYIKALR